MAAGAFPAAIAGILEDRDFALNTPRMEKAKEESLLRRVLLMIAGKIHL